MSHEPAPQPPRVALAAQLPLLRIVCTLNTTAYRPPVEVQSILYPDEVLRAQAPSRVPETLTLFTNSTFVMRTTVLVPHAKALAVPVAVMMTLSSTALMGQVAPHTPLMARSSSATTAALAWMGFCGTRPRGQQERVRYDHDHQ